MEEKKKAAPAAEVRGSPSSQDSKNASHPQNAFPHWDALIRQMGITQNKNM